MNREQAHRLLDRARAGAPFTADDITEALMETGDIDGRQASALAAEREFDRRYGAPADALQ